MERYNHLQTMPNSPLTPLTPLSENTKFEFNFGGDGSLDQYINNVRQKHRVEQHQKKLLQHANQAFAKKPCTQTQKPKRYSEEFLKLLDVFEAHEEIQRHDHQIKQRKYGQLNQPVATTPKPSMVKITYTKSTPVNVRTPLKTKKFNNISQNSKLKPFQQLQKFSQKVIVQQQPQIVKPKHRAIFQQASPVNAKPLCPLVTTVLQQSGLANYCGLFQREEIDVMAFNLLKLQDLHQMGITNEQHCDILIRKIYHFRKIMENLNFN